jgi:GH24 family phage-related lysozyme (muramidase)
VPVPPVASGAPTPLLPVSQAPANTEYRVPATAMSLSPQGLEFIKGWEKLSLQPYNDSEGYCTIGWGRLVAKQKCEDLKDSADFNPYRNGVTEAQADSMLKRDIKFAENHVKSRLEVPLYQQEYDALVSLIFNLGTSNGFRKCPKLLLKLNSRDYSGCCDEFADITNNGTRGLVKRRQAEMKMFRNKVYDSSH